MRAWTVGVVGVWGAWLGGCLADSGGRVTGDTVSEDTRSDATGDVTGDSGGTDASDVTCGSCDDGDPCTYDYCDAGVCQHVGVATGGGGVPLPTCTDDGGCDDGNACTADHCVAIPGGCGGGGTMCVHEPVPGCGTTCQGPLDCDDGNACTDDYCGSDGVCSSFALEGCEPMCTSDGIVSVGALASGSGGFVGDTVKTEGVIAPWTNYQGCNDGPTCDCSGFAAVTDGAAALGLRPAAGPGVLGDPAEWRCQTHGCTQPVTVACAPIAEGVAYRLWGLGLPAWDMAATGAGDAAFPLPPPPQPIVGIEVARYCLDTAPASLTGSYEGQLEVMPDVWIAFKAKLLAVDQGVIVTFEQSTCPSGTCPDWAVMEGQSTVLEEGDGRVGLDFVAPSQFGGTQQAHALLFSNHSALAGRWGPPVIMPNGVAIMIGGRMSLTRLGTGRLPAPIGL